MIKSCLELTEYIKSLKKLCYVEQKLCDTKKNSSLLRKKTSVLLKKVFALAENITILKKLSAHEENTLR